MTYAIGLTGGIGSGKTTVANLFATHGIAIIDTDAIAHSITAPGGAAMPAIRREFGDAFVAPDGSLDRERPIGWFVGWAEKDGRRVVFARLVRFDRKPSVFPGLAAKESVIADLFARPGSL